MHDNFQDILDCLAEKPPRSRLEPYSELIMELRRRKRTYREIIDVLAGKCDLRISISTLHDFVGTKAKEARRAARLLQTATVTPAPRNKEAVRPREVKKKLMEDRPPDNEVFRKIAAFKQGPRAAPADTSNEFQYNPDEPLRLMNDTRKPQRR